MARNPTRQQYAEYQTDKASPATNRGIPALPHVVWRCIVHHLRDCLSTLLHISRLSADLQDICRPYTSSFFHTIRQPRDPLSRDFFYHNLLRLVLEGHVDASLIYEFYYVFQYNTAPRFTPSERTRPGLPNGSTEQEVRRYDQLLRDAAHASPFIDPDLEASVCERFQRGDQDAALAVLLPLCTKLKLLQPPIGLELCDSLFRMITREYQQRNSNAAEAQSHAKAVVARDRGTRPQARTKPPLRALPFSELVVLKVQADQHTFHSFPLFKLIPMMCIPSLLRIILEGVVDQEFSSWPAEGGRCSCPEIYFQQSSLSRQAALAFAEELEPPSSCKIRQWYQRPRPDVADADEDDPTWDSILVERRSDGTKSVEIGFEEDGGNPGYEYPWVSWLWRGKMEDWKRLDEEFELEDGDEDVEWLQGLLA